MKEGLRQVSKQKVETYIYQPDRRTDVNKGTAAVYSFRSDLKEYEKISIVFIDGRFGSVNFPIREPSGCFLRLIEEKITELEAIGEGA